MEIGWTDMGSGGYILVSCAHNNTSLIQQSDIVNIDGLTIYIGLGLWYLTPLSTIFQSVLLMEETAVPGKNH